MKTFTKSAAQGDMMIIRLDKLPEGLKMEEMESERPGYIVVAHSETGHDHCLLEREGLKHYKGMDVLKSFLVVPDDGQDTDIIHLRETHTHETLRLPGPGVYLITRQREHDLMAGWRVAAD